MAIKADGNCCFHVSGVIGLLCRDSSAVKDGYTSCARTEESEARAKILANFNEMLEPKREFFPDRKELDHW